MNYEQSSEKGASLYKNSSLNYSALKWFVKWDASSRTGVLWRFHIFTTLTLDQNISTK
jgi:hypothetical protein